MPSEEWFLIVLLIAVGGARVLAGIFTGKPMDGETTVACLGLALGLSWGVRELPWRRRRRSRRSAGPGKMHDGDARDRASDT